ncbi:hypothetical protein [uncultured Thiothrix sp.]|uniref:hypothetical protein n=1 Tax=uncultured Thiothrix sp. TaxID=223185 RepID=UPI002627E494|nr:hypothetical protein [uncultured Thiothrix sp.]HRJ94989.1 hypothetical protein [Candidatus Thiothrix moscowensis]
MRQIFIIYTIIGLMLTPFIYSNNAQSYRPESTASKIGSSLGNAFYWPSYLFSIEPEVNSESVDTFQSSILNILKWRADKLFTGARSNTNGEMVFMAISNCLAAEGLKDDNTTSLYDKVFTGKLLENQNIEKMRSALMEKMNGFDFADIISAGVECDEKLARL